MKSISSFQFAVIPSSPSFFFPRLGFLAPFHLLGREDGFPGPRRLKNLRMPYGLKAGKCSFTFLCSSSNDMSSGMRAGMAEASSCGWDVGGCSSAG